MDILKSIVETLQHIKKNLKLNHLLVLESSNGFVMASTLSQGEVDSEAVGSLSSGILSAIEALGTMFKSTNAEMVMIHSDTEKFFLQRISGNYFLFINADNDIQTGWLLIKLKKMMPALIDQIEQFMAESSIEISELNIEDITEKLDSQFELLFAKG